MDIINQFICKLAHLTIESLIFKEYSKADKFQSDIISMQNALRIKRGLFTLRSCAMQPVY